MASAINGDGHTDILWRYKDGTVSEYQMNGTAIIGGGGVSKPGSDWTFQKLPITTATAVPTSCGGTTGRWCRNIL
jgi:hypothetical protein